MPRLYVRLESSAKPGRVPTPAEERATVRALTKLTKALGIDAADGLARDAVLGGVTMRLEVK